jgi:ElaB/YqjD/DUF883 family membrane-anchored ribosome-binding protein
MSNMGNIARDTAKETGKVASAGAKDIQEDLEALRDDVTRLTQQLASVLASKGNKAFQRARTNVEGVISDVQDKGMEAVGAVREVGDNVVDAIDESLKKRPYTTLALAAGIGFLFGATWRK